jgi:hypothetical protein
MKASATYPLFTESLVLALSDNVENMRRFSIMYESDVFSVM